MLDRWHRKGGKNKYDPQIGEAAKANVALAERSEAWNQNYFDEFVKPAMTQLVDDSRVNTERQGKLFDLDYAQAQLQDERYRKLGIPAEDRYYKMVDEYSAPEEQEKQARAALGDSRVAQASQQQQMERRFQSLGISPTSGAALSAASDRAVMNAANDAAAGTRAREAAKTLGMVLTEGAANRNGLSNTLAASSAASGKAGAATQGSANAAQIAPGGAANVNTSFGTSAKSYGANLDAFVSRANTIDQTRGPSALSQIASMGTQLGSAAMTGGVIKSDRRLKKHATKIATLAHDIGLWAFRYLWEPAAAPLRYGYMADEVEKVFPHAVVTDRHGYKMVDYSAVMV